MIRTTLAVLLLTTPLLLAQTAPAPIDALYTRPATDLTPAEIHTLQTRLADWPNLARYRAENAALPPAPRNRVVFFGDSITDAWGRREATGAFFPASPYLNRGISGQTTPQMLLRFQQDVIALHPAAVLILAGTNDLAGNSGLSTLPMIQDNFRSIAALARAANIRLIIASVLPTDDFPWRRGLTPAARIVEFNTWLKSFAAAEHAIYLDYYTALATPQGAMKPGTSKDGVHPTAAGYAIMAPLAQAAIDQALATH